MLVWWQWLHFLVRSQADVRRQSTDVEISGNVSLCPHVSPHMLHWRNCVRLRFWRWINARLPSHPVELMEFCIEIKSGARFAWELQWRSLPCLEFSGHSLFETVGHQERSKYVCRLLGKSLSIPHLTVRNMVTGKSCVRELSVRLPQFTVMLWPFCSWGEHQIRNVGVWFHKEPSGSILVDFLLSENGGEGHSTEGTDLQPFPYRCGWHAQSLSWQGRSIAGQCCLQPQDECVYNDSCTINRSLCPVCNIFFSSQRKNATNAQWIVKTFLSDFGLCASSPCTD